MRYGITTAPFLNDYRAQQAVVTETEFNKLTEMEKLDIIKKQGRLVTALQDQSGSYQLYLLDSFYVEVVKTERLQRIQTS